MIIILILTIGLILCLLFSTISLQNKLKQKNHEIQAKEIYVENNAPAVLQQTKLNEIQQIVSIIDDVSFVLDKNGTLFFYDSEWNEIKTTQKTIFDVIRNDKFVDGFLYSYENVYKINNSDDEISKEQVLSEIPNEIISKFNLSKKQENSQSQSYTSEQSDFIESTDGRIKLRHEEKINTIDSTPWIIEKSLSYDRWTKSSLINLNTTAENFAKLPEKIAMVHSSFYVSSDLFNSLAKKSFLILKKGLAFETFYYSKLTESEVSIYKDKFGNNFYEIENFNFNVTFENFAISIVTFNETAELWLRQELFPNVQIEISKETGQYKFFIY